MGAMARAVPGDEPALKASDLKLEEDFGAYRVSHRHVDREGFVSAYRRRRAWFCWLKGWTAAEFDEYLRPLARNAMREHPAASRESAWAFASKQVVAIVHMTRGSEGKAA